MILNANDLSLGLKNIRKRPYRSFCLILAALIGSYAVFVGLTLKSSLNHGITRMQERLGADLMIVPEDSEAQARNVLLTGTPEFFYMDSSIAGKISEIGGVDSVTTQFYFTSLSSDCCSTRVQLIAFEPGTDFVITPWINEKITDDLEHGQVIIGSEVTPLSNGKVKFYGSEYAVEGKRTRDSDYDLRPCLDLNNVPNANYQLCDHIMTRDTMHLILDDAKAKGYQFLTAEDDSSLISTVLLKLNDKAEVRQVEKEIYNAGSGVKILETDKLIVEVSSQLDSVGRIISLTLTVLLVFSFFTMVLFFSVIFHERKKDFAILRILGSTSKKISFLALSEGFLIGAAGGIAGMTFGILTVFPFNRYIENRLNVPYLMPSVPVVIFFGILGIVTVIVFGAVSSFLSTISLSHAETYYTMREGE